MSRSALPGRGRGGRGGGGERAGGRRRHADLPATPRHDTGPARGGAHGGNGHLRARRSAGGDSVSCTRPQTRTSKEQTMKGIADTFLGFAAALAVSAALSSAPAQAAGELNVYNWGEYI